MYAFGGSLVDNVKNPTRCTLDSKESIAGIQFYSDLIMPFDYDNVYYAAEITQVSPDNLNNKWGRYLFTKDGRINIKESAINLLLPDAYGLTRVLIPKVKVLRRYSFYYGQASMSDNTVSLKEGSKSPDK